jgi:two-component response regulator (ARR-A family)
MATLATETQFHVLAVDDSLIDRKLIERLLKTSSYQGILMSKPKGIYWIVYYFEL